ncbi:MAG: nucleotidyltransferase family protein [Nanoarchaeota archaeon]|nr:nucleotidyltransferase family protein [Nanoarchaeota archaeon]MBU1270381.1 nucleotidyltransferase family protein [Nanoarchaeota archaeon]MBU1604806.1 nucleotidyltransferase family protein [Nanoarchaeota archaeon]MBU2443202.1 nucleotidyltransferase family protein [Nanoarchaeota archaeon]
MKTAIVLAGGFGTRLRPLTYEVPKPLIPVQGVTLTEKVISKLKEAGVSKVYLSIGYMADKIIDYFKGRDVGVKIEFLVEKEPLGTGGCFHLLSKKQIKEDFSKDFIVVNGDNLFDLDWEKMLLLHKKNDALITIALTEVEDVTSRGVVKLSGDRIVKFVEKPKKEDAPSNYISSGYYIFSSKVFLELPAEKKFMLERELFPKVASNKKLFGYYDSGQWFDTGTFERWEEVIAKWKK